MGVGKVSVLTGQFFRAGAIPLCGAADGGRAGGRWRRAHGGGVSRFARAAPRGRARLGARRGCALGFM